MCESRDCFLIRTSFGAVGRELTTKSSPESTEAKSRSASASHSWRTTRTRCRTSGWQRTRRRWLPRRPQDIPPRHRGSASSQRRGGSPRRSSPRPGRHPRLHSLSSPSAPALEETSWEFLLGSSAAGAGCSCCCLNCWCCSADQRWSSAYSPSDSHSPPDWKDFRFWTGFKNFCFCRISGPAPKWQPVGSSKQDFPGVDKLQVEGRRKVINLVFFLPEDWEQSRGWINFGLPSKNILWERQERATHCYFYALCANRHNFWWIENDQDGFLTAKENCVSSVACRMSEDE